MQCWNGTARSPRLESQTHKHLANKSAAGARGQSQYIASVEPTPVHHNHEEPLIVKGRVSFVPSVLENGCSTPIQFGSGTTSDEESHFCQEQTSNLRRDPENPEILSSPALKVDGFIAQRKSRILIDGGAEGNFISEALVRKLKLKKLRLSKPKKVTGLQGQSCWLNEAVPNVSLKMGAHKEQTTLLVLPLGLDSDVVLGMPWLQRHNSQIDWVKD